MTEKDLLISLIREPSFSSQEDKTAGIIQDYFSTYGITTKRLHNNIIASPQSYDPQKKNVLLNSHHDTVKVVDGWKSDPFGAEEVDGKIIGLGSNDAGASLVCLIDTFIHFYHKDLPYNLFLVASGEEENFGPQGLSCILPSLPQMDFGIIGEPTSLTLGVAQKGLIVVDGQLTGKAGHAARDTGVNAIDGLALDINFLKKQPFHKKSDHLGFTTAKITMVNGGTLHNVIPDSCNYVLDVRVNDLYTLEEVMDILQEGLQADLKPRSLRWHSRGLPENHPIFMTAENLEISTIGSPTLSDQVHCEFPTVKIGPGDSSRSHTAEEYILLDEIEKGKKIYRILIENLNI